VARPEQVSFFLASAANLRFAICESNQRRASFKRGNFRLDRTHLRGAHSGRDPRIHDLRHTFAVRSLEQCRHEWDAVARHVLALSTYLGHAHVTNTYWYLQATPVLLGQIAEASEALLTGGAA
jgi:integrase